MNQFTKRILSLSLGTVMLASAALPAAASEHFSDVGPEFDWAATAIEKFAKAGIVGGIGDGLFAPDSPVTREQLAKILVLGFELPEQTPDTPSYGDVPADKWSYSYIESVTELLPGKDGSFEPHRDATRAEVASSAVRALGLSGTKPTGDISFSDISDVPEELQNDILIAASAGIINGYEDGTFKPNDPVTRAETVVILDRAVEYITTANEQLVALEAARFGDSATLPAGTETGDVTALILDQLGTRKDLSVSLNFSLKSDPAGLFEVKDGVISLKSTQPGSATITLLFVRGEVALSKDVSVTLESDTAIETFYNRFAVFTGETQTVAAGENQQKLGVQLAVNGELRWYYSKAYDNSKPFPVEKLFLSDDPITEIPEGGVVCAELGDQGTVRRIYYTESDMNTAVANGQDGAMITDLSSFEMSPTGTGYTFYRASLIQANDNLLTIAPIGKDGRAEIESTESVSTGTHYSYYSDPDHYRFIELSDRAVITLVDGDVLGETVTGASLGASSDLLFSVDFFENYCVDFVVDNNGEIIYLIAYLTPQSNDFIA